VTLPVLGDEIQPLSFKKNSHLSNEPSSRQDTLFNFEDEKCSKMKDDFSDLQ
jgi:hypothetical protein